MCMDSKENTALGVTVVGAEGPSNYHVAQRSEAAPTQTELALPCATVTPVTLGMTESMERKKRGRPRKYGPDGSVQRLYSPMPVSASAPPAVGGYASGKRGRGRGGGGGRGRSAASEAKQGQSFPMVTVAGDQFGHSDGANFTPHVITVNVGEDVTAKIISFCQQGPRAICILAANGIVSNAILRQSDSSGGTLTYEGRFEIVNLSGSFSPTEREGTIYRAGGLSVSLSSPNGQVVGGCVAGLLIAASPIQIIVGSFLPIMPQEAKPKKPKAQQTSSTPTPFTITALPTSTNVDKESCNGQGHVNSAAPIPTFTSPASFHRESWPNTHSIQGSRTLMTDINISLPDAVDSPLSD
ncbi:hypothetical protein RND81_03G199700 [Saponaria officinalis]|uniref:AT-hook motif nuclear-localized protein n=1 Tax=Saponaria officinalis TaxID=3572 RepID=A0AAW1MBY9_SAPOF